MDKKKNTDQKNTEELSNAFWASKAEIYKQKALNALREVHWQWYIHYLFYRGEHYAKFNTETGKVINPRKGVTVNLIRPVVRALSNNISKLKLKTTIYTDSLDDKVIGNTVNLGRYWDKKGEELELTKLYRKVVKLGCLTGAVPVRVVWNESFDDGNGGLDIDVENPFLTLPDPDALSPRSGNWLIRIVKRPLDECVADEGYDQACVKKLSPEQMVSDSPIFNQVVRVAEKINQSSDSSSSKSGFVWVTELYVKEAVDVKGTNALGKEYTKKGIKIRKVSVCQNNVLANEVTDLEDFPIEWFMIEEDGISLFPEAWVKDLIPLVQAINKHESQMIEYIDKLPGGIIKMMGGKIKLGRLENGLPVYEIDGQLVDKIQQLQLPPMPANLDNAVGRFRRYLEDIGAFSEVSRGIAPAGATSGEYLKALMAGDSNNTIELKEQLTDFATRLTKKSLWNIAKYMNRPDKVILQEPNQSTNRMITAYGGETPMKDMFNLVTDDDASEYGDILEITSDNNIRIEIDSDITYTLQSKQDELVKLYGLKDEQGRPIIPISLLLKAWGFGNVSEVMQELERQRIKQAAQDMAMAKAQHDQIQQQAQAELGMNQQPQGDQQAAPQQDPQQQFANEAMARQQAAQAVVPQQ